jgi:hypothetical protein
MNPSVDRVQCAWRNHVQVVARKLNAARALPVRECALFAEAWAGEVIGESERTVAEYEVFHAAE